MNTPIRLTSNRSQVAFLVEISNRRLKHMTNNKHSLAIIVMKWVLERDCIEYEDKYKVNTKIFSHFVASFLDI